MKTAVLIPAYNEALIVAQVIDNIKSQLKSPADIVVVDDGSSDNTFSVAKSAGVIVLRHSINRGQGAAIKTGISFLLKQGYDRVVFFDADGQMEATEITLLLDKLNEGYDVVLGSRNLGKVIGMPTVTKIIKKLALIFTRISTGLKITDTHNGFQAWTAGALKKIKLNQDRYAYASQLEREIGRAKLKYVEVPVTINYTDYSKKKGQSLWNAFVILWDLLIK